MLCQFARRRVLLRASEILLNLLGSWRRGAAGQIDSSANRQQQIRLRRGREAQFAKFKERWRRKLFQLQTYLRLPAAEILLDRDDTIFLALNEIFRSHSSLHFFAVCFREGEGSFVSELR